MAAAATEESDRKMTEADSPTLSQLLDAGWKFFEDVSNTSEPTGSNPIQVKVKRGIAHLEQATRLVAQLDLFSQNEELEELATADIKYLMLPALLGALTMKEVNLTNRLEQVQKARVYFMDFLKRCKDYSIMKFELPKSEEKKESPENLSQNASVGFHAPDLYAMAAHRQAKIERYKQTKEAEAKLTEIKASVDSGQAEDEIVRDYYLLTVRKWINIALDEVESIDQESQILKTMGTFKKESANQSRPHPQRPPMKPFILTKDAVQSKVFGAGYPSLPTMTVNDWYEQHRRETILPDRGIPKCSGDLDNEEREKEEKERQIENDDDEALQKARDWDNWKDTHRRGYGNRQNMG
ncbi:immunoglobulin-binding protein 1 [Erpetoichthys calabaricus]|uniref:Immunoglobulin (CD79A) binding protein 1 n=1 Tax=Erpetoichthys calabaricus TaxID=27687 RepID=A0A8C4SDQ1_ERPCA|nr:immunoglobulin-binding protein 1 [Erpetoichthys calabaricus]